MAVWIKHKCTVGLFVVYFVDGTTSTCFDTAFLCSMLWGFIRRAWNWLVQGHHSATVLKPAHLNSSGQAVKEPVDQRLLSNLLKGADKETSTHSSIYLCPCGSSVFPIQTVNSVLLMAPALKQELTLRAFSRRPDCMATASRQWGEPLEGRVSSLWPDKSTKVLCVTRAAEIPSAPDERGTMRDGNCTSKATDWD